MNLIYHISVDTGHDNLHLDSGNNEYHCHLPNEQLGQTNFPRNGYFRKSIACEAIYAKVEKPYYNTQRIPNDNLHSPQYIHPASSQIKNGYIPWPAYATVQNRQRHHRASILPPGVTTRSSIQDNDGMGGAIRRFASVQLRSKSAATSKGRKVLYDPMLQPISS